MARLVRDQNDQAHLWHRHHFHEGYGWDQTALDLDALDQSDR